MHDGTAVAAVSVVSVFYAKGYGAEMKEDFDENVKSATLSFECDGCGEFFESWERLRQHQVDCQEDDFENAL